MVRYDVCNIFGTNSLMFHFCYALPAVGRDFPHYWIPAPVHSRSLYWTIPVLQANEEKVIPAPEAVVKAELLNPFRLAPLCILICLRDRVSNGQNGQIQYK